MSLRNIQELGQELKNLSNKEAWDGMDAEARKEALVTAKQIEGRIREIADLHNAAVEKLVRIHNHVPRGAALHPRELPLVPALRDFLEEIALPRDEDCFTPFPDHEDEAPVIGVPENVAFFYRFGEIMRKQASFLADEADARHTANLQRTHGFEESADHVIGIA